MNLFNKNREAQIIKMADPEILRAEFLPVEKKYISPSQFPKQKHK